MKQGMKRSMRTIAAIAMTFAISITAFATAITTVPYNVDYTPGTGTASDPFVYTVSDNVASKTTWKRLARLVGYMWHTGDVYTTVTPAADRYNIYDGDDDTTLLYSWYFSGCGTSPTLTVPATPTFDANPYPLYVEESYANNILTVEVGSPEHLDGPHADDPTYTDIPGYGLLTVYDSSLTYGDTYEYKDADEVEKTATVVTAGAITFEVGATGTTYELTKQ